MLLQAKKEMPWSLNQDIPNKREFRFHGWTNLVRNGWIVGVRTRNKTKENIKEGYLWIKVQTFVLPTLTKSFN